MFDIAEVLEKACLVLFAFGLFFLLFFSIGVFYHFPTYRSDAFAKEQFAREVRLSDDRAQLGLACDALASAYFYDIESNALRKLPGQIPMFQRSYHERLIELIPSDIAVAALGGSTGGVTVTSLSKDVTSLLR